MLRVGYVGAQLGDHPVGRLLVSMLQMHTENRMEGVHGGARPCVRMGFSGCVCQCCGAERAEPL